jgi:hypothetical protein
MSRVLVGAEMFTARAMAGGVHLLVLTRDGFMRSLRGVHVRPRVTMCH